MVKDCLSSEVEDECTYIATDATEPATCFDTLEKRDTGQYVSTSLFLWQLVNHVVLVIKVHINKTMYLTILDFGGSCSIRANQFQLWTKKKKVKVPMTNGKICPLQILSSWMITWLFQNVKKKKPIFVKDYRKCLNILFKSLELDIKWPGWFFFLSHTLFFPFFVLFLIFSFTHNWELNNG